MMDRSHTTTEKRAGIGHPNWVALPRVILERLEDFDTAIILARAAAPNDAEKRHWDECLMDLRLARRALDEMHGPGITRRLV
ncbi:hypothetical protein [Achromobacter sp. DH1f]|uniref:hypothetical protein n=1 Tax=Achromobacter sp. DH1f TaxID=1397275 RepID=UPI000469ECDA|nr:hypothetical protein [Achromobacter sp. DH1f]